MGFKVEEIEYDKMAKSSAIVAVVGDVKENRMYKLCTDMVPISYLGELLRL